MQVGIVGLPNVGKTTLFNALTGAEAEVASYPFCTIEPNIGVVEVPDERLLRLSEMIRPQRTVPTTIKFLDVAGLVRGSSHGEGLGNQFLAKIRETDAIAQVVRCFEREDISHVEGELSPLRDIEIVETELLLADLAVVERRLDKALGAGRSGDEKAKRRVQGLEKIKEHLQRGKLARLLSLDEDEEKLMEELSLLTRKPMIYVANVSEDALDEKSQERLREIFNKARDNGAEVVIVAAKFESELAQLEPEERKEFLREEGLEESGLDQFIKASYKLLDLITFFTTVGPEVRAWTIKKGTRAPQAAGKVHSDMERGFIRAEVVSCDDLLTAGSVARARELGIYRLEGKEYVVQDGDVIYFKFAV